jgi:hypothetical protein
MKKIVLYFTLARPTIYLKLPTPLVGNFVCRANRKVFAHFWENYKYFSNLNFGSFVFFMSIRTPDANFHFSIFFVGFKIW